jgi:hypothetical protein
MTTSPPVPPGERPLAPPFSGAYHSRKYNATIALCCLYYDEINERLITFLITLWSGQITSYESAIKRYMSIDRNIPLIDQLGNPASPRPAGLSDREFVLEEERDLAKRLLEQESGLVRLPPK